MNLSNSPHFSGSYRPEDVHFLLKPLQMELTDRDEKEALIQSGKKHYSDMLSEENPPSPSHQAFFNKALELSTVRLASEVYALAQCLIENYPDSSRPIVLVSLVRAGAPLGVMLHRALKKAGRASVHYGISIIRGRGVDETALSYIEGKHGIENIVMVDGWTGKGAVSLELKKTFVRRPDYNGRIPPLVVLADPCGSASLSYSSEDWLIPFGVMGASVSGLLSRSVWQPKGSGLHGCVVHEHLKGWDVSNQLVERVDWVSQNTIDAYLEDNPPDEPLTLKFCDRERMEQSKRVVNKLMSRFFIDDVNRIKPSLVEATRAVMRRVPDYVLVKDRNDSEVKLLTQLSRDQNIPVIEMPESELGPYRAVTIIKKVGQ